jgi:hypothetical protein
MYCATGNRHKVLKKRFDVQKTTVFSVMGSEADTLCHLGSGKDFPERRVSLDWAWLQLAISRLSHRRHSSIALKANHAA